MKYLFFTNDGEKNLENTILPEGFRSSIWRPKVIKPVPEGLPTRCYLWRLMHYAHIFSTWDYSIFLIWHNNLLVHHSFIFPKYYKYSFMGSNDLQVGDIYTRPEYRNRGLANFAVRQILENYRKPGRKFWYIVDETNIPSIRLAKNKGFKLFGEGQKHPFLGIKKLGFFKIEKLADKNAEKAI
jgi:RimJ/RimL family protein N-acetyltransferase